MLSFDSPLAFDSVWARLDPRCKLAGLGACGLAVACARHPETAWLGWCAALGFALSARLPLAWVARRNASVLFVLAPFIVLMPLLRGWEGVRVAILLAAKAGAILTLALVALGTTPLTTLLHACRALMLPHWWLQILLLSYRYLFLLQAEYRRARQAARLRGFQMGMNRHAYQTLGHLIGTVFVRGIERSEGVMQAMRARGFDGQFHSLTELHARSRDIVVCVVLLLVALGLVVADYSTLTWLAPP